MTAKSVGSRIGSAPAATKQTRRTPKPGFRNAAPRSRKRLTASRICVTCGDKGAAFWDSGKLVTAPAPHVEVRDTVGAGDAFMAGLMCGLTRKQDSRLVLENACRLGAYVASHNGATPLFPATLVAEFKNP